MEYLILLPVMFVVGCNPPEDKIEWRVTSTGLECTNPDLSAPIYGICEWYCRDYRGQKDVDVSIWHEEKAFFLKINPSSECGETDFSPFKDKK